MKKRREHEYETTEGAGHPAPSSPEGGKVRIRMLKDVSTQLGPLMVGKPIMVERGTAEKWIAAGLAEEDKSLDGPPETT